MWDSSFFINALSPKFYVALTGTSSLISGLILIFEWWYFRKYGTSFIEQFSIAQLSPWFGGLPEDHNHVHMPLASAGGALNNSAGGNGTNNAANSNNRSTGGQPTHHNALDEDRDSCRVWRNPLNLYRGAEYQRFYWATNKEPLTYYDMNLSAQDHQTFFTCEADAGKPEYEIMQTAWRERNTVVRIKGARSALEKNPECAPAYILLAEEEATTIVEAEKILKQGLKVAEVQYRRSQHLLQQVSYVSGTLVEAQHRRDTNVLIYIKRRLAMCARRLGKVKEAVKIFRDLMKEVPPIMNVLNVQENLLESLLELRLYSDASVLLSRYDNNASLPPRSAALLYAAALLKARSVADKFSAETASRRGLTQNESAAIEAIHRAVEFNPHVPKYLLEQKPLILPPEHILRRGDSEAIGYAFFHLPHWKAVDGALDLLQCTWEGAFRLLPRPLEHGNAFGVYPTCTECADRELLPAFHEVSIYPKKDLPFFVLFTAGLCSFTALLTLLTHQYPEPMGHVARWLVGWLSTPFWFVYERIEGVLPSNLLQQLSRI